MTTKPVSHPSPFNTNTFNANKAILTKSELKEVRRCGKTLHNKIMRQPNVKTALLKLRAANKSVYNRKIGFLRHTATLTKTLGFDKLIAAAVKANKTYDAAYEKAAEKLIGSKDNLVSLTNNDTSLFSYSQLILMIMNRS